MTDQYDDNERGCLFRNDKKTNDAQPDYRGKAKIDGKDWGLSGWIKTIQQGAMQGQKMLSLAFSEPYQKPEGEPAATEPGADGMPL